MSLDPFDAEGQFHPIAEGDLLRRVAVRGAGTTLVASGASFCLQLISTVVLARLLTPNDFGVVTMVTTFSLLFCSFGLNGFSEVILQREDVTHSLASNLFWINLGAGASLSIVFACLGPLMARFYHDPLVKSVAEGMSLTIVAGSLSVVHLALLNRATRFSAVAANTVVAYTVSVVVSIILALMGWGYWALVTGYIVQRISISIGAWIMCRWTPCLPRRVAGTAASVKFAMNVYWHFGFSYFTSNIDNLLVGWRYGAPTLGLYKKAFDLFYLPANQLLSPIAGIAIATLSRFKSDRAYYQRHLLAGISLLAFVGMGIGADFTLVGRDMIRFILGPGWAESGRIFTFFGPGIGVMLLYNTHGWIHISAGRPDRWFRWGVIEFIWTVGLFVVALPWGPSGVALAWTASSLTLMLPAFWYAGKPIGLGVTPVVAVIWKFFAASVLAGCGAAWLIHVAPLFATTGGARGAFFRAAADSVLFFALYLCVVVVLHRGLAPIRQTGRLIMEMLPDSSATRDAIRAAGTAKSTV
jgi:O-antigen/teichoic acid export membrane protein